VEQTECRRALSIAAANGTDSSTPERQRIALLPWGHTIEEFLDTVGLSVDQFCSEMSGGWLFGYTQALQLVGFDVMIFCFSVNCSTSCSMRHKPTGATICLLPAKRAYVWFRRFFSNPYAWETEKMFAGKRLPKIAKKILRDILPYLGTPPITLVRELKRRRIDMVLCQEYEYARFDVVSALGSILHFPVFATFQGGTWQVSRIEKYTRPHALRRSAGLIIGPTAEAGRVQSNYRLPAQKIARIANPLDTAEWQPVSRIEARNKLGLSPTARIAISHGRINIFRKGLDVLLEAWGRLRAAHPKQEWQLVLIGSGEGDRKFRAMLESQADRSVVWIDTYLKDRPLMRTWLSAANVYVMASRHEGFPVAPLEAMACGLPIVATEVPGITEILGGEILKPGIVVPVADVARLSAALASLLNDDMACETLGLQARQRIQDFSLRSIGEQLRNFILSRANIRVPAGVTHAW
jgi:glycosyltransferase involved in cell wall biosynthesis